MKTNILTLAITLTVGIILAGSLMMPVLNDATTTETTFDNSSYAFYQMKELEIGDEWTRSDSTWYYGEEELTNSSSGDVSIVAVNNGVVRQNGQMRGMIADNNVQLADIVDVSGSTRIKINNANTLAFTSGYGAVLNGDYVLKTYTDSAYVNGDTPLWVTGVTYIVSGSSTSGVGIHIEGTINDGFTSTTFNIQGSSVTDVSIGEITVNSEEVSGYNDLYKILSVDFPLTGTYSSQEYTVDATYSTFVMPKEITAELSQHLSPGEIAILNALPVLIIAALVVTAAGAIYLRRDD